MKTEYVISRLAIALALVLGLVWTGTVQAQETIPPPDGSTTSASPQSVDPGIENVITHRQTFYDTDYVSAGCGGMRDNGTCNVGLTISGIPETAVVNKALLYWHGPTNSADPNVNATGTFEGQTITGTNIGFASDNCWGYQNSQAYVADVTAYVPGDGVYQLSNFASGSGSNLANTNGASLLVFYNDGITANDRDVYIYQGNDSDVGSVWDGIDWSVSMPDITYNAGVYDYDSGAGIVEMHVSDGQAYPDGILILNYLNPPPLDAGNLTPEGGRDLKIFQGTTVPDDNNPQIENLWDIKSYDVTGRYLSRVGPRTTTWNLRLEPSQGDCISLVVVAVNLLANMPNFPPTVYAGGPYTGEVNTPIPMDQSTASDRNPGTTLTYSWTVDDSAGNSVPCTFDNSTILHPNLTCTSPGNYWVTLTASDGEFTASSSNVVMVTQPNQAPTAEAGGPYSGDEDVAIVLDGSGSSDPDPNTTLTYSWTVDSPLCSFSNAALPNPALTCSTEGTYTVTLQVSDGAETAMDTAVVTVNHVNEPPVAEAGGPYVGNEDTAINLAGAGSDPDPGATLTFAWTVDSPLCTFSDATLPDPTLTCSTEGTYNATLEVSDGAASATDTAIVTVNHVNEPPTAEAGGPYNGDEDTAIILSGSGSDPDSHPLTYLWSVDSGLCSINNATVVNPELTCSTEGTYTVTLAVSDGEATATDTASVTVNHVNEPPVAEAGGPYTGDEDIAIALDGTGSDSDPGTILTYSWAVDSPLCFFSDATLPDPTLTCSTEGAYTVTLAVHDGVATATDIAAVIVNHVNEPPVAEAGGPYNGIEDAAIHLDGTGSSDPDPYTMLVYYWTVNSPLCVFDDATSATPYLTCSDPGSFLVTLEVCDGVTTDTDTADVTVIAANRPPTAEAGEPYTGAEGAEIQLDGSASSDPDADALTYSWVVDSPQCSFNNAAIDNPGLTCTDNGSYTVTLTVSDGAETATDTAAVTVSNVNPVVGPINVSALVVPIGTSIQTNVNFTDQGASDTHTAEWNWDDGAVVAGTVTQGAGSGSVTGQHTYTTAGVYTIIATVTDDDFGSGSSTYQYVVVYDPSGGFVTGGGWINSPAGAYAPDPTLSGKANFGFVSKYLKGAKVPTGNTEFQFQVAGLSFESTAYEWLVVAGAKAQYKGVGTINDAGTYKFILWAGDGTGTNGSDTFRIRIWSEDESGNEYVVYDNGTDQGISGGSIVVHAK